MKVADSVSENDVIRELFFDDEDILFIVEGYEFEEDEMRETDYEPEFKGEYFHETYSNFKYAVEKYLELLENGWEVVRFGIRLKSKLPLKNIGVNISFDVDEYGKSLRVLVNSTKLCESYAKKLSEIERILREVK